MTRIGFVLFMLFAMVAFCGDWGNGIVVFAILAAWCCWQMDREARGRGMH